MAPCSRMILIPQGLFTTRTFRICPNLDSLASGRTFIAFAQVWALLESLESLLSRISGKWTLLKKDPFSKTSPSPNPTKKRAYQALEPDNVCAPFWSNLPCNSKRRFFSHHHSKLGGASNWTTQHINNSVLGLSGISRRLFMNWAKIT